MSRAQDNGCKSQSPLSVSSTDVLSILPPEMTAPSGYTLLSRSGNRYYQIWRSVLKPVVKIEDEVDLTAEAEAEAGEVKKYAKTTTGRKATKN